jgi:riboflavin kinase/FMN adenylyltransferase
MTLARRLALLEALGVDGVVVEPFTRAFAAQSASEFASSVLASRLKAQAVVVGWDFRFGSGRGGDVDALRAALSSAVVEQVSPMIEGGEPISSSRIRRLIAAGDVVGAGALMGRPHRLSGTVVHGDARGRTIGFPTANLRCDVECLPAWGVYAVDARIGSSAAIRGVLNIGMRPTFQGSELRIEAHLLDWQGDLYGAELSLDLVARIRDEQRFASVDALVAQIREDVAVARRCA